MPKVSFIVPVYNAEKVIGRCVDSILKQEYDDFELILVDDGSKDHSWELLEEYAHKDPRVKAIHKDNGGVSNTRNRGIKEASGEYIRFVDADDWITAESTKLMVREMENNDVDLVIGDFYRVKEDKIAEKGSIKASGVLTLQEFADEMIMTPADLYYGVLWNKLYKKSLIDEYQVQMDENINYSEDMIYNLEYLLHVQKVAILKVPVYYYIHTPGSLVNQSLNLASTVKMKKNVISYYTSFYKNTFDSFDYQERLPIIYSYLISASTDALALPFMPGTKKLGEEKENVVAYEQQNADPMQFAYLSNCLLEHYLRIFAKQHNLDLNEALVLYCLKVMNRPCSIEELSELTNLSKMSLINVLSHLLFYGFISHGTKLFDGSILENYIYTADGLTADFQQIETDFFQTLYKDLSAEEIEIVKKANQQACLNILKVLK